MQTTDPTLTNSHSPTLPLPRTVPLERVAADRKVVESQLADDLQNQAIWILERVRELRKNLAFDAAGVRTQLAEWAGGNADLCGQLQALDGIEHPGSAARPRSLQRPRP